MSKLIDTRTGGEVREVARCCDCGEVYHDGVPQVSCGDEGWSVCGECRTVEGDWDILFWNDSEEEVPEEFVDLEEKGGTYVVS